MIKFLQGKKTFIVVALFVILAVVVLLAKVDMPDGIYAIFAALGLGGLRVGITHLSKNKGWKTYVAVIATAGIGALQLLGIELPFGLTFEVIYGGLASLGVVGVRDALRSVIPKH